MKKGEVIYLGSDHAGFFLKRKIKDYFNKENLKYEDVGSFDLKESDYVDYAKKVVAKLKKNKNSRGILICGTGTGMVVAANRFKGIRAAVAYDKYSARMARHDNDSNVLCLRGRKFSTRKNIKFVKIWLAEKFSGVERHKRRIRKLEA